MDVQDLLNVNFPPVTLGLLIGVGALGAAVLVDLVSPLALAFDVHRTLAGEIWRPIASLLFLGKLNVQMIMSLSYIATASSWLETSRYSDKWQYLWALTTIGAAILALAPTLGISYPASALTSALTYIWSRYCANNEAIVMLVFRVRFSYIPFYILVVNSAYRPEAASSLILGIVIGHVVYFLDEIYPLWSDKRPLQAPWVRPTETIEANDAVVDMEAALDELRAA